MKILVKYIFFLPLLVSIAVSNFSLNNRFHEIYKLNIIKRRARALLELNEIIISIYGNQFNVSHYIVDEQKEENWEINEQERWH